MNACLLLLLSCVLSLIQIGYGFLECYHCHQTSTECINGVKRHLQTINCTESKCFVLKYETDMPGVTVRATYRGCYIIPEDELMKTVLTEKHKVRKKHFHLCNSTLCNGAVSQPVWLWYWFLYSVHILLAIIIA